MAEGSKVRFVRCPKCDNLLSELPEYSVYKCGGCGAILRAKQRGQENDVLSEKSDEERGGGAFEKLESLVEKGSDSSDFTFDNKMEDNTMELGRRNGRVFVEKRANVIHRGLQRAEKKEVFVGKDTSVSEEFKDLRLERSVEEKEYGSVDKRSQSSEHQRDHWTRGTSRYMDTNRSESVNSSVEEMSNERIKFPGSVRSRPGIGWSRGERISRFEGLYGNNSSASVQERPRTFAYPDEGPSNHEPYLFHGYGTQMYGGDCVKVPDGLKNLEQERAEILRKLDELKEQLSRSYHVVDKPKEREPTDRNLPHAYGNQVPYNVSMQPAALDKQVPRPPHYNHNHGPVPFMNHHHVDMQSFYPPRKPILNKIPEYDDPFQQQMTRNPQPLPPHQYPHVSPHEYYSGQYRNFNSEPIASYPHETSYHAPTCACLSCYDQNLRVPPRTPPTKPPFHPNFYRHDDPVGFRPQNYPPQEPLHPHMHTRWSGDLDAENDVYGHPRRMGATHKIGRLYHPIAGGAPFITCHKCFELLKLPRKLRITGDNRQRLRCGACSAVMLLELENKKLITSEPTEPKHLSADGDKCSPEVLNDGLVSSGSLNANGTSSCSEDFKKSGYDFQSAPVEDESLNLDESEKRQGHASSSSISSREDESFECVISREDVHESAELPLKSVSSPRPPRSPIWQESDSPKHVINRYELGNNSKRMEHDNVVFSRVISQEISFKDTAEATELDVSFEEYQNNSMSLDSGEISKEEDRFKFGKGSDSFFMGFIKKSLRDFSRHNYAEQGEKPKVFINGQPLLDRVVKQAEKFAGPVRPGDYWYDFRAGFWGVMGQPCLGIIPPFIEEFNYQMPSNCGAGNTRVYVNGRELNQRDLDLLAQRGLPTTSEKFYIIEISGKVMDEDTGKELYNLGRLAPTVERTKQGFGMKARAK